MLLLFIFLQAPAFEAHGRFSVSYSREETGDTVIPFISRYWLHYGIIDLTFRPRDNLEIIYSNDFGARSGYSRFYADFFIPRFKGNITVGKFSLPFGMQIKDHTSLLEDNIGLGLRREKTGIGLTFHPFLLNLSGGIFFPSEDIRLKLYAATISIRPWLFDIGVASLLEKYSNDTTIVNRQYYEYYIKLFVPTRLSLLVKCITGTRMNADILGYAILLDVPLHPAFSPFVEYESFDSDRSLKDNALHRIVVGMKYEVISNAILRLGYYIKHEEPDVKNNLLSLMLIIWW